MLDLANLHDEDCEKFWRYQQGQRKLLYTPLPDEALQKLRDQVRQVWDPSRPRGLKEGILLRWLQTAYESGKITEEPGTGRVLMSGSPPLFPMIDLGTLFPSPSNLHAQLVLGVLKHSRRLAKCHNPECLNPYFIAKRRTQKYCERGPCTTYAQRQYALKDWNKKGRERRKKRQAEAKKRAKARAQIGKRKPSKDAS